MQFANRNEDGWIEQELLDDKHFSKQFEGAPSRNDGDFIKELDGLGFEVTGEYLREKRC